MLSVAMWMDGQYSVEEERDFRNDMEAARNLVTQAVMGNDPLFAYHACHNLEYVYGARYFRLKDMLDLEKGRYLPEGKNDAERKADQAEHFYRADRRLLVLRNYWMEARHYYEQAKAAMNWWKEREDVGVSEV